MMSEYRPDSWKIVEIISEEPGNSYKAYKVLASWYGGFAGANSWKLSSGIMGIEKDDKLFVMPQSSGSVYICHEDAEHMSSIMHGIFGQLASLAEESTVLTVRKIDMKDFLELQE